MPVAQVEALTGPDNFEVNPASVNQPASLFTYISGAGTATGTPPPNAAGEESSHADSVGQFFYGNGTSVAPGVSHVDNYEAGSFIQDIIQASTPQNIAAKVINQSFVATDQNGNPIQDAPTDQAYDNYIAEYNKLIVSGAGNSGPPDSPSTSYNGISVGSSDYVVSTGPTADGRSKPDISAPGFATSFTAPQVSAAAAVLVQAGQTGYGGSNTTATVDSRLVKALLLNGADKPADWAHTQTQPLDPRYGAGVLDLSNSLAELQSGQDSMGVASISPIGSSHLPVPLLSRATTNLSGWDFNTVTSGTGFDSIKNYLFNVTGSAGSTDTLTATLTWNRQVNQSSINNLDLYLYNSDTRTLQSQSVSSVDNVEELYVSGLAPGHYALEVLKHGGTPGVTTGDVSNAETYALAFNFAAMSSATPSVSSASMLFSPSLSTSDPHSVRSLSSGRSTHVVVPTLKGASSPVITAAGALRETSISPEFSTPTRSQPGSAPPASRDLSLILAQDNVASSRMISTALA